MFDQYPGYSEKEIAAARKKVEKLAKEAEKAKSNANRKKLKSTMDAVESYYNTAPSCCKADLWSILLDLGNHLAKVS